MNSRLFLRSVCTIQSEVINFQHVLTWFAIFQSFTYLFRELNDREIENHYKMNSENVETWHGIVIDPHSMCKIVERVTEKTGCTSFTNWQSLSKYSGFWRKLICYKGISFFKLISTPDFFCVQYAPFKATSSIFNPFWLHFLFFMHLLIILSYKTLKLKSI